MIINSAEILSVGTEILIGDIVNTDAAFISKRLAALGISQYYQAAVGDNSGRLRERIDEALSRCDLLILTGGLGPTYDDLTKETAAAAMGRRLVMHGESLARIKDFFVRMQQCFQIFVHNIPLFSLPRRLSFCLYVTIAAD